MRCLICFKLATMVAGMEKRNASDDHEYSKHHQWDEDNGKDAGDVLKNVDPAMCKRCVGQPRDPCSGSVVRITHALSARPRLLY